MRTKADVKASAFDLIAQSAEWQCDVKAEYALYYINGVVSATEVIINELEAPDE